MNDSILIIGIVALIAGVVLSEAAGTVLSTLVALLLVPEDRRAELVLRAMSSRRRLRLGTRSALRIAWVALRDAPPRASGRPAGPSRDHLVTDWPG